MSVRKQGPPVDSSWRMVEGGENDSFDTSIVPGASDLDDAGSFGDVVLSTDPSQGAGPLSSQEAGLSTSSQDSLQGFLRRADHDERVILREPFLPSLPSARQTTPRARERDRIERERAARGQHVAESSSRHRTPVPEFFMPVPESNSPRRPGQGGSTRRTARGDVQQSPVHDDDDDDDDDGHYGLRRRHFSPRHQQQTGARASPAKRRGNTRLSQRQQQQRGFFGTVEDSDLDDGGGGDSVDGDDKNRKASLGDRIQTGLAASAVEMLAWLFGVVGLAFRYAQRPLAIMLAIYLMFGAAIFVQNMVTKSIYTSLSPLCRIPGSSLLDLPFCPKIPVNETAGKKGKSQGGPATSSAPVEFDELMTVQSQFEAVLEESAAGVSLPLEMKRSEASIRDLRTMVRYSELAARDELVLEFDNYIETTRAASSDLQRFNTHVGSAVDAVISINRWTSRYIDGLAASEREQHSLAADLSSWIFAPFLPPTGFFWDERVLTDKYVEHTALVSDRIAALILEAQAVLRVLTKAEDHLSLIYDVTTRSSATVRARRDEILWTLWTLVGGNARRIHNLNSQLGLLRRVDTQRSDAVRRLGALVVDLEKMQAGLADLRDRVAQPELLRDVTTSRGEIPLSVHIETIDRGVERLEGARSRIRAVENERIREALARGGLGPEERLIDGP